MSGSDDIVQATRSFLQREGSTATPTYNASRRVMIIPSGNVTHFVHTDPMLPRWSEDPVAQRKVLERRLLALRQTPASLTDEMLRQRLLPRIRSNAYFAAQELHRKIVERAEGESGAELSLPHQMLNDELGVHLVFDLSEEAADVNDARMEGWTREFAPLYRMSLEHLRERTQENMHAIKPGLFASTISDSHDAARVLLTERLDALPLKGEQVVMLPHLDLLLVTTTDNQAGLVEMARLGLQAAQQPYGLSGTAFKRTANGLVPWLPPVTHVAWDPLKMAQLPSQTRAYSRQKELLEAWLELEGDPAVVGPMVVLEEGDHLFSAAVLIQGQTTLLPKAERIAFAVPEKGDNARVWAIPWELAEKLPGVTVKSVGLEPERFRATGFPDLKTLEETLRNL
ncbi:MAG: hypothetical protein ACJ790_21080 [Myxococcaceae bacterium]